jgi:hypothetical protein
MALRETARLHNYQIKELEIKAWQQIAEKRPDIVEAAKQLERNVHFLNTFQPELKQWSDTYRQLITPDLIQSLINTSFDLLLTQITEQGMDMIYQRDNIEPRSAKAKQRVAVNLVRNFVAKVGRILRGRTKGSKSQTKRFTYENLCRAIRNPGFEDTPTQKEVAKNMGYQGRNKEDQLRRDMRIRADELRRHGHENHVWKNIAEEIRNRDK